ncbi:MAG: hypothetical protein M3144_13485 [Actinomycetota bacterium]|nr:hypothetical protein [Actinomycetota bacterium]
MQTRVSLSETSRVLTRLSGLAFGLLGLVFFLAPQWSADEFPWRVTDFMAMTMGGWCLGNAFMAWVAARDWRWASVQAVLVYLWVFAAVEIAVLVWFRDLIRFDGVLTWPYLITLGLALVTAVIGVADLARLRPQVVDSTGPAAPPAIRALGVVFVILVGFLAVKGLVDPESGRTLNVFPEALSPFTIRAFAVFYGAIAVGAIPLIFARSLTPTLTYALAGMGLIVPITAAAFVYIGRFDFADHPLQVIYIGAYVGVLIAAIGLLSWARGRGRRVVSAAS